MKKFFIGLILGAGLMIGVSAHAEVANLVGQVIEGQFPVKIDGEQIESPGIVVNGTSYLPVRTMGELLGYDVSFNADFGVELRKKPGQMARETSETRETRRPDNSLTKEQLEYEIQKREKFIKDNKKILETMNLSPDIIDKLNQANAQYEVEISEFEKQLEQLNEAP